MSARARLRLLACVIAGAVCAFPGAAGAQPRATTAVTAADEPSLLLELRLGESVLSDSFTAWSDGSRLLLPLGELARLLTLAIAVDAPSGAASGYVLSERRSFGLNLDRAVVSAEGGAARPFDARRAKVWGDEIYVDAELLSQWLPLDLVLNLPALQLRVVPREPLPLQARLERERSAAGLRGLAATAADPGYPRRLAPYAWVGRPFVDQTLSMDLRSSGGRREAGASLSAYLTADLLGMEGSAWVSSSRAEQRPDYRVMLARHDPDGTLLGPLRARSLQLGDFVLPGVSQITGTGSTAPGVSLSNRPLDLPTTFDRQNLRGDLPPGWDVTLYFNDALIGYQQSRGDGLYAFDDLPLSYGRNDFTLVFNGPLGQVRTERRSFGLDQSIVRAGEFLYSLAHQQASEARARSVARFDLGLPGGLVASSAWVRLPRPGVEPGSSVPREFGQFGLRAYGERFILTSEFSVAQAGGGMGELGLKTRIGPFSLDVLHARVHGRYDSEAVPADTGNALRQRTRLRMLGALGSGPQRVPVALDLQRDLDAAGLVLHQAAGRVSFMAAGAFHTHSLAWQRRAGGVTPGTTLTGSLQSSRRVLDMGLSSQLAYSLEPEARLDSVAITADRMLQEGHRVNAGWLRDLRSGRSVWSAGTSRRFGSFALALSGSVSARREWNVGTQLFMALGHDPRSRRWFAESLPLAGSGALAAQAFVDRNLNGVRDPGEEPVPNAAFILNGGGRHPARTDAQGAALLSRLPPGRYSDIALDPSTLEDPQWKPLLPGARVLPRPGLVQPLDFPVASTADVDGTVSLREGSGRRGIGDAEVELVEAGSGRVAHRARSASDGFYTVSQVLPGRYRVRIAPGQLAKLRLQASPERELVITPDSDFVNGIDLELQRRSP